MNKQEIIDRVGQEKYAAASAWFRTDSELMVRYAGAVTHPTELITPSIPARR